MAVFSNWLSWLVGAGLLLTVVLSVFRKSGITRDGQRLR